MPFKVPESTTTSLRIASHKNVFSRFDSQRRSAIMKRYSLKVKTILRQKVNCSRNVILKYLSGAKMIFCLLFAATQEPKNLKKIS